MFKDFTLQDGKSLRADILGGHCTRLRLGDGINWHESGLNRYGILDENALDDGMARNFTDNAVQLDDGCRLAVAADGTVTVTQNGETLVAITQIAQRPNGGQRIAIRLQDGERLYGLGDENRDAIQKRGRHATMIVKNVVSYIPVPYIMSTRGWAVFLNTTVYHVIDAGAAKSDELVFECGRDMPDFYLFTAKGMPQLLDYYTRLTGRPALLPRWAYGFTFVCDEREVRARDVLYEAYEYRRQDIPCDVIGLEPDWMEKHYDYSTEKKWSEKRFHIPFWLKPNSSGTFAGALHRMGFKLSLWLCTDYDFSEYEEQLYAEKHGLKRPSTEILPDAPSPDDLINDPHFNYTLRMDKVTVPGEPWFQHLKKFVDDGADAFKLDGANQVVFHADRKWFNGMDDTEMHNLYPLIYNKQMSDGFADYTNRRPMIYSSGGYAGIQRYSATWTGDTGGGPKSLTGLMNLAMSGHSNGTCDLSVKDVEGIHAGMLLPWSQLLGWHQYTEPWFQGDDICNAFRFYAKLRYHLLPYIYAAAWKASLTGLPIMRPLPLAFPDDENAANICNQFMLGDGLMVGDYTNRIYLPEGVWYNYWTRQKVQGGQWLQVESPAAWGDGTQPVGGALFAKGGAIIPTAPEIQFVDTAPLREINWEIFVANGESSSTHYDDDGISFDYRQGKYATTTMTCTYDGATLTIAEDTRDNGHPELLGDRINNFDIVGLPEHTPIVRKSDDPTSGK